MGGRAAGVRTETKSSVVIDFYYRGVRCRERLKLDPTKANLKYAANLRAEIQTEIARGTFDYARHFPDSARALQLSRTPGAAIAVGPALDAWLRGMKGQLAYSTFRGYELSIERVWWPACGNMRLAEITRTWLKSWVAEQSCGLKRIRNVLLPMRGLFAQASEDELIQRNPFVGWAPRKIEPPKEKDDIDPFTPQEVMAILGACVGQVRNLFEFGFWTGLRTSELIALRWEDVDLTGATVTVRRAKVRQRIKVPKTKSGNRTVVLLPPALEAIKAQRQYTALADAEVFNNPRTDAPWLHDGPIRKTAWQPTLRRAGVRYRYPYQMRHTFASTLLSAGENPVWVAAMMGHKDWAMIVRVYGRWIPSVAPDAGKKAAAVWSAYGQLHEVSN